MATTPIPRFTLVAPSADGTCCPCSALSDPCTCAGLIPIIRCRTRSALAEMIGYHAFTDPADPPDTYLLKQLSGSFVGITYAEGGCSGESCTVTDAYSGSCIISEETGQETVAGLRIRTTVGCSDNGSWPAADIGPGFLSDEEVRTRTTRSFTSPLDCRPWYSGSWRRPSQPTARETLDTPYTEQQALYRATNGLIWSDWAVLTQLPGCSALWELRSGIEDYDFAVRESEYQLEFPALTITEQATDPITGEPLWITPGVPLTTTRQLTAQVEVRVDILRRPWNGGLWTLYKTEAFGPMTITGKQTLEGVVPNDRGYETAINNVRYRVVG